MSPIPPQLIAKPAIETVADYFRAGRKRLKKAINAYPDLPPWEALIEWHHHHRCSKIRGKSARKYFQEDSRALELILRHRRGRSDCEALLTRLKWAIDNRRGRPPKYGAGKKARDVKEEEAIAVFRELKRHALEELYMTDVVASLFVLVASHSGFRPIELKGGRLVGSTLFVRNAKRKPGQAEERGFDLSKLPDDVLIAVQLLILLVPKFPTRTAYKSWAKDLAEALARACNRAGIRRLSLYSFRHLALATWKKAGLSGPEIAELAGHISERSARHYSGARHGLDRAQIIAPASIEPAVQRLPEASGSTDPMGIDLVDETPASDSAFIWEDPPKPMSKQKLEPEALSPDIVFEHFEKLAHRAEPRNPRPSDIDVKSGGPSNHCATRSRGAPRKP
ncbi:MAG: hypothetical protein Devi2KO_25730 [Devosia indica]